MEEPSGLSDEIPQNRFWPFFGFSVFRERFVFRDLIPRCTGGWLFQQTNSEQVLYAKGYKPEAFYLEFRAPFRHTAPESSAAQACRKRNTDGGGGGAVVKSCANLCGFTHCQTAATSGLECGSQ